MNPEQKKKDVQAKAREELQLGTSKSFADWIPVAGTMKLRKRVELLEEEVMKLKKSNAEDIGAGMIVDMDLRKTQEAILRDMKRKIKVDTIRLFIISYDKGIPEVSKVLNIDHNNEITEITDYSPDLSMVNGRIVPLVVAEKRPFHLDLKVELDSRLYKLSMNEDYQLEITSQGKIKKEYGGVGGEGIRIFIRNANASKVWEKYEMPMFERTEEEVRVIGVLVADNRQTGHPIEESEVFVLARGAQVASMQLRNARMYEERERAATHDKLTGVYNRRKFDDEFNKELTRALRYKHTVSLLMIDIDHFKEINDTHGHIGGDNILKELAPLMRGFIRKGIDTAARYGGEEFAIILPETDVKNAASKAEDIRKMVAGYNFSPFKGERQLGVSIGVAELRDVDRAQINEIGIDKAFIDCADKALYEAKNSGRNKVCVFKKQA